MARIVRRAVEAIRQVPARELVEDTIGIVAIVVLIWLGFLIPAVLA